MNKSFLSIETSLNRIFLVLYCKGKLYSKNKILKNSIEVDINHMLRQILNIAKINFSDLENILVSIGPGSYTGTRVGIATAKAISVSIKKPILSYTNFEAIYYQGLINTYINKNSLSGVLIKANKSEFYYQDVKREKFGNIKVLKMEDIKKNFLKKYKLGNFKGAAQNQNYHFCLPKKEAILRIFLKNFISIEKRRYKEVVP